ncbi:MAG: peptide chain release factor N(5)-glutamine methyltransferase [Paludibacteraceae bacterium]|nr:peptide chain release factor N(5)-glutamine methyltransferase [Paludibacteraceae bacterium]
METLRQYYNSLLSDLYSPEECATLYRTFVSEVTGMAANATYFCKDSDFTQNQITELQTIAQKLAMGMPYQHLLGWTEMNGLRWLVSPDVLIPRPETAEMIGMISRQTSSPRNILDWCTGSGFIAISLALRFPKAGIDAADISEKALVVARQNALLHQAAVRLMREDALNPSPSLMQKKYDLIVSNPPYICNSEQTGMPIQVKRYEPAIALFVPDSDPLLFYRHIAAYATTALNPGGTLWFEINERFGAETCQMLEEAGWHATLLRDMAGKDRFVCAQNS